ncbi:MAG: hypothetical protein R3321_10060, partial [Nitrososphaeraceae archaeon]|nr:hypothetical protein [Nitrososphaeraceae archaeon]
MSTKLYIFDLDGTLANIEHRVHYVRGKKHRDYDTFFKQCINDKPNQWIIDLLNIVRKHGEVLILSGRSDVVEIETRR